MKYRAVDMRGEPRREQFDYFRTMANPYFSITVNCDITALREATRGKAFFLPLLYCAVNAANAVPELRRRLRGDTVIEYERCLSSHTVALDNGSYCYCTLDCGMPFEEFLPMAQRSVERAKAQPDLTDGEDADSLYFVSSLPWLSFTAIALPTPVPADSNVRITFGKAFTQGEKTLLPLNLTAHHALADGIHAARFFEEFEQRAATLFSDISKYKNSKATGGE